MLEDLERLTKKFREMYAKRLLEDKRIDYRAMLFMYDEGVKSIIKKYKTLKSKKPYVQTDIYDIIEE